MTDLGKIAATQKARFGERRENDAGGSEILLQEHESPPSRDPVTRISRMLHSS